MATMIPLNNSVKESEILILDEWYFTPNQNCYDCLKARFSTHYTPVIRIDFENVRNIRGSAPVFQLLNYLMNAVPIERTLIIDGFEFCDITYEIAMLFNMIKQSPSIVHLCFQGSRSYSVLGEMLPQLSGKTNLKSLHFKAVFFKFPKAIYTIQDLIINSPMLTSFVFRTAGVQNSMEYSDFCVLVDALLCVPSLTYLDFSDNSSVFERIDSRNDALLARLVTNSPFLKIFKIRYVIPPYQEIPLFTKALANHKVLEELDVIDAYKNFSKNDPDPKYVQTRNPYLSHVFTVNNTLKTIHFNSGFSVNNKLNVAILLSHNPSLTKLDFSCTNYISDYEMEVFASVLSTNTTLKYLSLKECVMHPNCLEHLGKALVTNSTLESLNLDRINCVNFSSALNIFFSLLQQNNGLRSFFMTSLKAKFNDNLIYRALQNHPTIETLRTVRNDKREYDPVDLDALLPNNHTLRDVDIRLRFWVGRNPDSFYKTLTAAIINNKNLIRLVIPIVRTIDPQRDNMYHIMQHENTNIMFTQPKGRIENYDEAQYQVIKRNRVLNNTLFNLLFPAINWVDPEEDEVIPIKHLRLN
jgi:hypothetical protein